MYTVDHYLLEQTFSENHLSKYNGSEMGKKQINRLISNWNESNFLFLYSSYTNYKLFSILVCTNYRKFSQLDKLIISLGGVFRKH